MQAKGIFKAEPPVRFVPEDERALEILEGLEDGDKVLMWVHKARYPEHHKLAWAVFQKIADATGQTAENIALWLKLETGRFDYVQLVDGRVIENPHSLKFESMSQAEFQLFWNDALEIVKDKVLPGVDDAVFNDLRDMISGRPT